MDPVRSSLGAGVAATVALTAVLIVGDLAFGASDPFVYATFTGFCALEGPPYCAAGTPVAAAITYFWFAALFALAWPLFFVGFTWGLPGTSGTTHGLLFGVVLWAGYAAAVLFDIGFRDAPGADGASILLLTLVGYLVYGFVLGSVYDHLAEHRTFLSVETD